MSVASTPLRGEPSEDKALESRGVSERSSQPEIEVGLLTGGYDRPYVFGLATALEAKGIYLDIVGGDDVDRPDNKFHFFDRTLLMLYYKLQGKRIALTAHNVNAGKRDANDSFLNKLSLNIQYHVADHIFVHTDKMKEELVTEFGIAEKAITVIPFGINNSLPDTCITPDQARQKLGISQDKKLILFFGNIGPYKGLDYLVEGFQQVAPRDASYQLIIAGNPRRGDEGYFDRIQESIRRSPYGERVIQKIEYIPDEETELYFKAADVLVLPYTHVFQSGVLFLGYSFGLPVIATNVGSLEEDIIEGRTGFLCKPRDPIDLAGAIERYFESDLFKDLHARRQEIRDFARKKHSWEIVGEMTREVYSGLLGERGSASWRIRSLM